MADKLIARIKVQIDSIVELFRNEHQQHGFQNSREVWYHVRKSPDLRAPLDQIVDEVTGRNPTMLSQDMVRSRIFYEVIAPIIEDALSSSESVKLIDSVLYQLLSFKRLTTVSIPVSNIIIDGPDLALGEVNFQPFPDKHKDKPWKLWSYKEADLDRVFCLATSIVPGDDHLALANARNQVEQALSIVRGIGAIALKTRRFAEFSLLGVSLLADLTPFHVEDQWVKEGPAEGFPPRLYGDIIEHFGTTNVSQLQRILAIGASERPAMLQGVPQALKWLGDSTKPDKIEERFVKAAFALECAVGEVGDDEHVTSRGITATLTERSAFLLAQDYQERRRIHKEISDLYRMRNDIVHGRTNDITIQQLDRFATHVCNVIKSLIALQGQIGRNEKFTEWTLKKRYN